MENTLSRITSVSFLFCVGWLLFFMAGMLMFYLGYEETISFNNGLIETKCRVVEHIGPTMHTCSEQCNCVTYCSGSGSSQSCYTSCQTCYYDCYDASIRVNYTVTQTNNNIRENTIFSDTLQVANDRRSESSAQRSLDEYPINYEFICLYDSNNPEDVFFDERNPAPFLAGAIIFFIVAFYICCCCSIYIPVELKNNNEDFHLEWTRNIYDAVKSDINDMSDIIKEKTSSTFF